MTLHFGGGAGYAEQFRGETKSLAIVKCDAQRAAILRKPDFNRPRRSDVQRAQVTVLFTFSIGAFLYSCDGYFGPVRPNLPGDESRFGRYQLGPTRLLPGSPTLAPPVVNATELGCWMLLSSTDIPTAAIAANNRAARKTFMALPRIDL
jgi:hypothetical protein